MWLNRLIVSLTVAIFAALALAQAGHAALLIQVDKSAQRMTVTVDGKQLYDWPVSTGGGGYDTPSGNFKPFRMEIDHRSDEWDDAPMPYSIFFTKIGHAIHGTNEQRNLGRPVSHGCVRLSVKNAATLWELVKWQKMANTTVMLNGTIPGGASPGIMPVSITVVLAIFCNFTSSHRVAAFFTDEPNAAHATAGRPGLRCSLVP